MRLAMKFNRIHGQPRADLGQFGVFHQTKSQSDLSRVKAKSEEELARDIADDPDFSNEAEDWYVNAELIMPTPKRLLSLRLDSDIIDWFKGQGPGYQTRMNAVLRAFVKQAGRRRV